MQHWHSIFLWTYAIVIFTVLTFCANSLEAKEASRNAPIKVGFVYPGPSTDMGWDTTHEKGRRYLETSMNGSVITTVADSVPENSQAERVMEKMIDQGNKIIFAASYGYAEPAFRVAKRHPDVTIKLCGHMKPQTDLKNVGSYFVPYYEPMYVAGIVAARMSKTNNIGFVAGYPVCNVLWSINAFTLGARSIKPQIKVHLVWTNTWNDAVIEAEATKALIERGADVMIALLDTSLNVVKQAEREKVFSVGLFYDLQDQAPNSWLTGQCMDWGPLAVKHVQAIVHGTSPPDQMHPVQDGYVKLASFGKSVPQTVKAEALKVMDQIKAGKKAVFTPPLKDRDDILRLASGQKVDAAWLDKMDWLVAGVEGTLPKK